jgi:DNA-binding response OmpR family regulator
VRYAFEDYVIDSDRRELTRGDEPIAVAPQVFDLLLHLVRNREHVVSKDELLDVVWAGRIVSESTLTSQINAARKAIGDSGQNQRSSCDRHHSFSPDLVQRGNSESDYRGGTNVDSLASFSLIA